VPLAGRVAVLRVDVTEPWAPGHIAVVVTVGDDDRGDERHLAEVAADAPVEDRAALRQRMPDGVPDRAAARVGEEPVADEVQLDRSESLAGRQDGDSWGTASGERCVIASSPAAPRPSSPAAA